MVYDATEGWPSCSRRSASPRTSASIRRRRVCMSASLLPVMGLARLQRFGHTPIAIVGGGTGMIGDPSGKSQERVLLSREQIERERRRHPRAARAVSRLRRARQRRARIVNNADWLGDDRSAVVSARRRQALHRQLHAAEGVGEPAARERRRHLVHRVQLSGAAGLRLSAAVRSATAARCRWAAAISGATSRPASI